MRKPAAPRVFFVALAIVAGGSVPSPGDAKPPGQARLPGAHGIRFVDEAQCAGCHPQEHAAWAGSQHDRAMEVAGPDTVLGDFDDAKFTHLGVASRFFQRDGRYLVETEGADGAPQEFEVAYTFGVHPLQQYLVPFPGGRLQTLPIAWDTVRKRWFHVYGDEPLRPGDPLHWTGSYQTWNFMCAECHSTDLRKNYVADEDAYATTWARIDVGCQACHGPGERHVAWSRSPERAGGRGLVVDFAGGEASDQVDACARCHARRHRVSPEDTHGRALLEDFWPSPLRAGLYHPDGQILDEVYVYGSFLQSRMYARGVRCTDCHDPHALELRAPGDALCTQCHREDPPGRFPSLARRRYDTPEHHFHPQASEGARCVSCHMPDRTYMQVDARRDHSFRIPRPDLSQTLGVPNACTGCHEDQSAGWAVEALDARRGARWRRGSEHAGTFRDGRLGAPSARSDLVKIADDPTRPAIVRATAVELLRGYGPPVAHVLVASTHDPEPLVRAAAVGGLEVLSPSERVSAAAPLLRDPVRGVRVEAARMLARAPPEDLSDEDRRAFAAALVELEAAEASNLDSPGARANLAVLAGARGDAAAAEAHYVAALRLDPAFFPASLNLATLYNRGGRNDEAERVLRAGIEATADEGELHYSLGLLLAEQGRLSDAENALGRAAALMPLRSRVHYNYALALQHRGRRRLAEQELLEAVRLEPSDPEISRALAIFYLQEERWSEALPHARRFSELAPDAPGAREMVRRIQAQAALAQPPG